MISRARARVQLADLRLGAHRSCSTPASGSPTSRAAIEPVAVSPVSVVNSHTHFDHVGGNDLLRARRRCTRPAPQWLEANTERLGARRLRPGSPPRCEPVLRAAARGRPRGLVPARPRPAGPRPGRRRRSPPAAAGTSTSRRRTGCSPTATARARRPQPAGDPHARPLRPTTSACSTRPAGILFAQDQAYYGPHLIYLPGSDVGDFARSVPPARRRAARLAAHRLRRPLPAPDGAARVPRPARRRRRGGRRRRGEARSRRTACSASTCSAPTTATSRSSCAQDVEGLMARRPEEPIRTDTRIDDLDLGSSRSSSRTAAAPTAGSAPRSGSPRRRCASACSGSSTPTRSRSSPSPIRYLLGARVAATIGIRAEGDLNEIAATSPRSPRSTMWSSPRAASTSSPRPSAATTRTCSRCSTRACARRRRHRHRDLRLPRPRKADLPVAAELPSTLRSRRTTACRSATGGWRSRSSSSPRSPTASARRCMCRPRRSCARTRGRWCARSANAGPRGRCW